MSADDMAYYWYWFVNIPGIGNQGRNLLLQHFGHPRRIYDCDRGELEDLLKPEAITQLEEARDYAKMDRERRRLGEEGIRFLHWESKDYPKRFRNLYDPPYGFYLKGSLPGEDSPALAIVGSRRASPYGRKMAEYFSGELSQRGIAIISGMAGGIDAIAHRAALDHRGQTLGILGGGIETMYPKSNCNLYLDMYQKGGILSEFNRGVPNQPGFFPMRNRLISGMSDAVLVVEAGLKSGSLITADQGIEQGKEIYAIPGRVTDLMSQGCNHLIAQGAFVAESPDDIFRNLCLQEGRQEQGEILSLVRSRFILTPEEERVLECMDINEGVSFEYLLENTAFSFQELRHILINLELRSLVIQPMQNIYLIKI